MIVEEIEGDLIEEFQFGRVHSMVHGCNCFHLMGAGIAGQIAKVYPKALMADLKTPLANPNKLGKYSKYVLPNSQMIINMYTQYEPGANFEYLALIKGVQKLNREFKNSDIVFGFPEIGCGIGGGQWFYVKDIIEKYGKDLKIKIVHYDPRIEIVGKAKTRDQLSIKGL